LNTCSGTWFIKEGIGLSNLLSVSNLSYSFQNEDKELHVFTNLSLDIKRGEFVSIIGASGSGKSTLFKVISGLLDPTGGQISLTNESAENRLGTVGYMPQKDLLLPWRTVMENILLPLEISKGNKKQKQEEIREWLSKFELISFENAYPHELSGGMKQRVAFLRSIISAKDLLLLDEPFGALDSLTKRKMHKWLLDLWEDLQKTILFITHDLEEALLLSDRIYILPKKSENVLKEVKVNFLRPRSTEIIYQSEFIHVRKELECLINNED
jgi:putative hydroxymethylpyrimidine transport system ATP-binding protein